MITLPQTQLGEPASDQVNEAENSLINAIGALLRGNDPGTRSTCLRSLGADWMMKGQPPNHLTEAGLKAAALTDMSPADVVTDLLLGFAAAREEHRARQWEEHLIRRVLELDGIHRVVSAANSTLDLDASLQAVVEIVAEVTSVEVCSIYIYDHPENMLCLRATHGLNPAAIGMLKFAPGVGIIGRSAEMGRPMMIIDVREEPGYRHDPSLQEDTYLSILCVPIILFMAQSLQQKTEKLQGVISIQTRGPREFTPEEIAYIEVVAGELAFSVSNAQLFQQTDVRLQQKIRELTTLQRLTAALAATLDHDSLLRLIAEQAVTLSRTDRADIYQAMEGRTPRAVASWGAGSTAGMESFIAKVIKERRPMAVLNAYVDERFPELAALAHREAFHSIFCLPLRSGEEVRGALCLYTREPRNFDYEQVQLLSTFADEATIAMENARLYEAVRRSLTIKSVLLQEMHHRVRNNLQTISALLNLQARRMEADSPARLTLEESVSRIQAIAGVHNLLCREDIGVTTVQEIAKQVVDNVRLGLIGERPVRFEFTGEPVEVASKAATMLALVINELIGNALHHGVADSGGTIAIDTWVDGELISVQVRDNGHPDPARSKRKRDQNKTNGLGFQIIETLATTDLGGSFTFTRTDGWSRGLLRFPANAGSEEPAF